MASSPSRPPPACGEPCPRQSPALLLQADPLRPPSDAEVLQWLTRDPVRPRPRSAVEMARFWRIRQRLLRHLRRDPRLWLLQGGNILWGLARSALCTGLFLVLAPPVLVFWAGVCWPAGDPPPPLPIPAPEGGPPVGGVPALGSLGVLCLLWLVMLDLLCGHRLSRWRNVCVDKAARITWAVMDAEPPAAGPAPRRPGAAAQDTQSAQ